MNNVFHIMRGLSLSTVGAIVPDRVRAVRFVITALACLIVLPPATADTVTEGKRLATDRAKGNCLACHVMGDGPLAGNVGPPLVVMKARFPQREALFSQIWDATLRNPDSRMPPFGAHGVLNKEEIERIIDYLYTL